MNNIIIKIENGIVADVYCTEAVNVIVVDRDIIRGGETLDERMRTAVMIALERRIRPEDIGRMVQLLVLERGKSPDGRLLECGASAAETASRV